MITRRLFLAALAAAQQQPDVTFSTGIRVVNILASVRTRKGEIIRDLTKDDFTLTENNRPQTIRYFSQQTNLPLTIGILVDTSYSQGKVLEAERSASIAFIEDVLRTEKDKAFVYQFDTEVRTAAMLTNSLEKLGEAITYVALPTRQQLEASRTSAGTLLYDAIETAGKDIMSRVEGRKAVIVLTDGVDTGSSGSLSQAVDACQRADTLIYGIYFTDSGFYTLGGGSGVNGRKVLQRMSEDTGGRFFEVTKKESIGQIYAAIQEELRSQYNIGYSSDVPVTRPEFRALHLSTARPNLIVQARDRYWAAAK
jgi:VWFA-related protein